MSEEDIVQSSNDTEIDICRPCPWRTHILKKKTVKLQLIRHYGKCYHENMKTKCCREVTHLSSCRKVTHLSKTWQSNLSIFILWHTFLSPYCSVSCEHIITFQIGEEERYFQMKKLKLWQKQGSNPLLMVNLDVS